MKHPTEWNLQSCPEQKHPVPLLQSLQTLQWPATVWPALHITGNYDFDLQIGPKIMKHPIHVIRNLHKDVILGIDFIHAHQLMYDPESKRFSWGTFLQWKRDVLRSCRIMSWPRCQLSSSWSTSSLMLEQSQVHKKAAWYTSVHLEKLS